jgi:hypothetical protein
MTRASGLAALVCGTFLACAAACGDIDVVTDSYATTSEAQQAGAIDAGWIPPLLPKGAHDIRAAHDLDRPRRWGLFNFHPADADALRAALEPEEISLAGVRCDIPPRIEWWPVLLRGPLDPPAIASAGLKAYKAPAADVVVLVNWNQGRAYYLTR